MIHDNVVNNQGYKQIHGGTNSTKDSNVNKISHSSSTQFKNKRSIFATTDVFLNAIFPLTQFPFLARDLDGFPPLPQGGQICVPSATPKIVNQGEIGKLYSPTLLARHTRNKKREGGKEGLKLRR